MELGLAGRTALVTAGSRGFGRAVAEGLGAEGARVALCARGEKGLQEAAEAVRAAGAAAVLARPVDLTDGEAVAAFAAETERTLGPVDLCLLNGGGPPAGVFADFDQQAWRDAYALLLENSVRLCRLLLPGMRARGWGRIVQITSISVRQPVDNLLLSNVLRPAVHALVRDLAREAAPDGVTINSVAPGYHLTDAVERLIARKIDDGAAPDRQSVLDEWAREIPAGRLGRPEEAAAAVLFLMSERAAYITGQSLVVDGGWTRGAF